MGDTYIVAEIGTGHGGDLKRAAELVHAAKESGADCAKFQYVIADEIIHQNTGSVQLPGGNIPLHKRFVELERDEKFYSELIALCEQVSIEFLCTPFGIESARSLRKLGVAAMKIASPEINYDQLLREVSEYGVELIVSTGVSKIGDIEHALEIIGRKQTTLLHCVTAYPAPEQDYNLRTIPNLARLFGTRAGVSDHSQDPVVVPGLAVALGACLVEKHFTLSRSGAGLDDAIAMDPSMFTQMCATVRRVDTIMTLDPEGGYTKIIGEFCTEFGTSRVQRILGDGIKRLAPSEQDSYATTRRSIHAVGDLSIGQIIRQTDVAVLRSERNLSPGLDPCFLDLIVGSEVVQPVRAGDGVLWTHLLRRPA